MDTKTADYLYNEDRQRFMEDYQEAVNYLLEISKNEVGVGVKPMAFLAASHAEFNRQRLQWHESYLKANEENKKLRAECEKYLAAHEQCVKDLTAAANENTLLKLERDALGAQLLDVQRDCVALRQDLEKTREASETRARGITVIHEKLIEMGQKNARLTMDVDALNRTCTESQAREKGLAEQNARLTEEVAALKRAVEERDALLKEVAQSDMSGENAVAVGRFRQLVERVTGKKTKA